MNRNENLLRVLINVDQTFIPKAEYVIRTFCKILNLQPKIYYTYSSAKIDLYYGRHSDTEASVKIYHSDETTAFFTERKHPDHLRYSMQFFHNEYIPFLFSLPGEIFHITTKTTFIRKDIVASAFYFLSCYQEYFEKLDGQNRYDYKKSFQFKNNLTETPVVDYYINILRKSIEITKPSMTNINAWGSLHKFGISLSHDMDYWKYWTDEQIETVLQYNKQRMLKNPAAAMYKYWFHFFHKKLFLQENKRNKSILNYETRLYNDSTVNLMSGLPHKGKDEPRYGYLNDEETVREIAELMEERSIGIHARPESAFDANDFRRDMEELKCKGFEPQGCRFHNLAFDYQSSFKIMEENGIRFDSTLGFWESIGFRAGTSFPFNPFNMEENRPFQVLEIPLIVMDVSLYSKIAMNLGLRAARKRVTNLVKKVENHNGHISLLWHFRTFDWIDFPGWGSLYWDIIKYSLKNSGRLFSTEELYEYWIEK